MRHGLVVVAAIGLMSVVACAADAFSVKDVKIVTSRRGGDVVATAQQRIGWLLRVLSFSLFQWLA